MADQKKTPAQEIRPHMDISSKTTLGPGFANEGAATDSAPPDCVKDDADAELCKVALKRLVRHVTIGELQEAIKENSELADLFDRDRYPNIPGS